MKILFKYATVALLLAGAAACSQPSKRASIIDENIAVAEKQIGMLADSSETGGVIRIPSTWKNWRIDYVPVDDWVSGFFAGTLWYMYELTGDEAWAARARKHTEILDSVQYLQWHHDVGFMVYDSYGNGLRLKFRQRLPDHRRAEIPRTHPHLGAGPRRKVLARDGRHPQLGLRAQGPRLEIPGDHRQHDESRTDVQGHGVFGRQHLL